MAKFEEYMEILEDFKTNSDQDEEEALEAAEEALSFVQSLHNLFVENGEKLAETPNCLILEDLIDSLAGELGAAALFLSEKSFARVPEMLRILGTRIPLEDVPTKGPDNEEGPAVPPAIVSGFSKLADRIDHARAHQQEVSRVIKDSESTEL